MAVPLPDPYRSQLFYLGETADAASRRKDDTMAAPPVTPAAEQWWGVFLDGHGRDSEEHKAFLGFLQTKGLAALSGPDVLADAYTQFRAFLDDSYTHDATASEAANVEAVRASRQGDAPPRPLVPRSSLSLPELEKPMTAATRPPDVRDPEASQQPSPLSDPNVALTGTAPHEGTPLSSGTMQEQPPPPTPEAEAQAQRDEEQHRQRGRRGGE